MWVEKNKTFLKRIFGITEYPPCKRIYFRAKKKKKIAVESNVMQKASKVTFFPYHENDDNLPIFATTLTKACIFRLAIFLHKTYQFSILFPFFYRVIIRENNRDDKIVSSSAFLRNFCISRNEKVSPVHKFRSPFFVLRDKAIVCR